MSLLFRLLLLLDDELLLAPLLDGVLHLVVEHVALLHDNGVEVSKDLADVLDGRLDVLDLALALADDGVVVVDLGLERRQLQLRRRPACQQPDRVGRLASASAGAATVRV